MYTEQTTTTTTAAAAVAAAVVRRENAVKSTKFNYSVKFVINDDAFWITVRSAITPAAGNTLRN